MKKLVYIRFIHNSLPRKQTKNVDDIILHSWAYAFLKRPVSMWNVNTKKKTAINKSFHVFFEVNLSAFIILYSLHQDLLSKRQAKSPVNCLLIKERQLSPLFKVIHFKIHFTGHPCFHNQPLISFNAVRSLCLSLSFKGMVQTVCETVYVYAEKKKKRKKKRRYRALVTISADDRDTCTTKSVWWKALVPI